MKKIVNIVGARPNFMKMAPVHKRMLASSEFEPTLIHTGQHYDEAMSKTFFIDLGMPEPDIYLGVGSGSHAEQTGAILIKIEKVMMDLHPDLVIVVGDVNSTIAASLVAAKAGIPVAHIESGLRSFDRSMPEEINRICTDAIAEMLFVTEPSGRDNLLREGKNDQQIHFVGNVMIDSLVDHLEKSNSSTVLKDFSLEPQGYSLLTLHRPSNVDDPATLSRILDAIEIIQRELPLIFPIHPRTRKMIDSFGFSEKVNDMSGLVFSEPLRYLDFLHLMANARLVLTDSGGIQEETTYLGIPCLTLRENTERPITTEIGTNKLVGMDTRKIVIEAFLALNGKQAQGSIPSLWDGKASERIVQILRSEL